MSVYTASTCDVVAAALEHIIKQFEGQNPHLGIRATPSLVDKATKFNSRTPPPITIRNYLKRIEQYAKCSDSCYIVALIYIDRLMQKSSLRPTRLNVHRLLMTSVLLAIKFSEDFYYDNEYYSKVGGMTQRELNALEKEMLSMLDFALFVDRPVYDKYRTDLGDFYRTRVLNQKADAAVPGETRTTVFTPMDTGMSE